MEFRKNDLPYIQEHLRQKKARFVVSVPIRLIRVICDSIIRTQPIS